MKKLFFVGVAALAAACGGSTSSTVDSGTMAMADAGSMVPDDTGAPMPDAGSNDAGSSWMFDPPRVTSQGGPVAAAGKVIPVFFSNDAMQSDAESFLKQLSPSTYWTATTKEYGVGDYTLGSSIVITDPAPASTTDADIQNWLVAHADGTNMAWPKADPNTVYAIFYPSTTTIDLQGATSCQDYGAYHSNTNLLDNTEFAYAVMPRCKDLDELTAATSHELIEWATDPLPDSNTAYGDVDVDHVIWSFGGGGGEVGDMCASYQSSYARIVGNFVVQRGWSNASMKAGHDPCVPAPADPYFNAAPELTEKVVLSFGGMGGLTTKGVKIPVGMSKTIPVHVYADGMTGPISLSAKDRTGGQTYLSFMFDSDTAMPGEVRQLTITSIKATTSNAASFTVTATSGQTKHAWYGLVGFK